MNYCKVKNSIILLTKSDRMWSCKEFYGNGLGLEYLHSLVLVSV
jgi:hypothetical protein